MVTGAREVIEDPEVSLAKRLVERFGLTPPIDVKSLVERYADLEFDSIPGGIDAICVGLKSPGRRPLVIVDKTKPPRRQRFTLAHELGHLVIPWHAGLIIDEIHMFETNPDDAYVEAEANRFASEVLAPRSWIHSEFDLYSNTAKAMAEISDRAQISIPAAFVRLAMVGPSGLLFAKENSGLLMSSGRTKATVAAPPPSGTPYDPSLYPMAKHSQRVHGDEVYHWWSFDEDLEGFEVVEGVDWKILLAEMVASIGLDPEAEKKFKQSINGTMSSVNSQLKENRTEAKLYNRIYQRFYSARLHDDRMRAIIEHPYCHQLISARVSAFLM